jgi:hypothetical protein
MKKTTKKTTPKKLQLTKDTLRRLDEKQLAAVAGGYTNTQNSCIISNYC